MNTSTQCPSRIDLRALLEGTAADSEQAELVLHLDHCPSCQKSLEALTNSDSSLAITLLEQAKVATPDSGSAYWPALEKAEQAITRDAPKPAKQVPVSLNFLEPAEDNSHIGRLSHFNIIRVVGRGGMGVVLHAVDTYLQRDVAVKVLDPELAKDELARKRFCREARAGASITHENVVGVHQVEHEEGRDLPFLVMELITGESLESKLARAGRLPLEDIVHIGMQTAAGLAAAHAKGLIHRDIKPGNILLERSGQRVKLTDFGLARLAEDVRLTQSGLVAGTPLYMSPEQARGDELDARSDLFSLGVVLYELAAGEPPFTGKTPLAVLKRLTDEKHQPLRERNPDLPEWFVGIVDHLLAKKPEDRFQSAQEVADVLEHFWAMLRTSSSTLPACPKKKAAHIWKTVMLGASAGLATVLIGAAALFWLVPNRDRHEDKIPPTLHVFKGNAGPLWSLALSKDGNHLAMGTDAGVVKYWDIANERVDWSLNAHNGPIWTLAISPRGDFLATGGDDGLAKIWDLKTRAEMRALSSNGGVRSLAFDAEGKRLVTGARNGGVKIWDVATGDEIRKTAGHTGLAGAVAFAPDGKTIASASTDKSIKLWDADSGQEKLTLSGHESGIYGIAFSPNSKYLASGGWDKTVRLWDVDSGTQLAKLDGHTQDVWSVDFGPEGKLFASAGEDLVVRLWDVESKKEAGSFRASTGAPILNIRFSPFPGKIVAGTKDGTARMWDISNLMQNK